MQTYFRGRVTPDGTMVTRHDPPSFEPVVLDEEEFAWGGKYTVGGWLLAAVLLEAATGKEPDRHSCESFYEDVLGRLWEEWTLTVEQIREWATGPDGQVRF